MVGYSQYHYRYDSGRKGGSLATGFNLRAPATLPYIYCPDIVTFLRLQPDLGQTPADAAVGTSNPLKLLMKLR